MEGVLLFIALVGILFASISELENGIYRPLNPIPLGIWLFLFMSVLYAYRGYMVKKHAKHSKEYYVHFAFAIWLPFAALILELLFKL